MNASSDLLGVGELLVDWIATEAVPLAEAETFCRFRGGSVANVTANVALLGLRAALAAAVGADPLGDFLRAELHRCGVETGPVQIVPGVTTSMVIVSRSTTSPAFIPLHGAHRQLTPEALPLALLSRTRVLFTSALALAREPLRQAVLTALAAARQAGALTALEPNYHPRQWQDPAEGSAVIRQALALVDVVKPSLDDAERFWGAALPPAEVIARYHALGPRLVVLTGGAQGAWVSAGAGVTLVPARAVTAVDVVGAGDAFWAGLLSGLLDGLDAVAAARRGAALAARQVAQYGPLHDPVDRWALDSEPASPPAVTP